MPGPDFLPSLTGPPREEKMGQLEIHLLGQSLESLQRKAAYVRWVECAWQQILQNSGNADLSLARVAFRCGVSENHLNVLLNRELGFSFHELLTRYRLLLACRMLQEKDYTFLEIAHATGFGSFSSLRRHCLKVLGKSPRQLRRELGRSG